LGHQFVCIGDIDEGVSQVSDRLSTGQRAALTGVALAVVVLGGVLAGGLLPPPLGITVAGVAIITAWRTVPGFWRTAGLGALAGAICGVLILAPGFRLAMRVVAILDPVRTPEFTFEGTIFIMVFLGVLVGAVFGIEAAVLRRAFTISGPVMALSMTAVIMGLLLAGADLRSEFVDLGAGAWLNVPMFATVVLFFSLALNRAVDRSQAKKPSQATPVATRVQA
jgi:hypothetical protein